MQSFCVVDPRVDRDPAIHQRCFLVSYRGQVLSQSSKTLKRTEATNQLPGTDLLASRNGGSTHRCDEVAGCRLCNFSRQNETQHRTAPFNALLRTKLHFVRRFHLSICRGHVRRIVQRLTTLVFPLLSFSNSNNT